MDAYTYSRERAGEELPCWTLEEMRLFLDFLASQRDAGLYAVALATGMRRGELLGLRRKRDVDLAHARILVRRQWTKAGDEGRKMVALKTGQKAWRTIDLDPFTVAVIDRQLAMVEAERRELGADYQDHGLLFPREDGSPQDPDWVTRKFERLAENCPDVPRIVFHGMRHTHATLLLEDGVSLKVVAERLGDREDTVVKLYGHVTPRGRALAVASVGTWWEHGHFAYPRSATLSGTGGILLVEPIAAALAAGAAAGLTNVVSQAVQDAYGRLKAALSARFPQIQVHVQALEARPDSPTKQASLAEELADVGAEHDSELLQLAQTLLSAIREEVPEAAVRAGVDLENIRAGGTMVIEDARGGDIGVRGRDWQVTRDIRISGARGGSDPNS